MRCLTCLLCLFITVVAGWGRVGARPEGTDIVPAKGGGDLGGHHGGEQ